MALYLKYRPLDFSSLVGQEFIKTTLKAAVAGDKTVGAYLFTGPRGTGKTSTARIFAKAINCESPKDGDPDLSCNICKAFADDNLIDVIEIDAASHTGVDNIREIIEKAQFQPTQAKYKIYIIDEVHMLSKGAFNALLKILEEPPKHVKFILATTEIHKVPDTILSRCQRYDFRNFSNEDLKSRLEFIASEEKVTVDDESYEYIIKNSEGGMRNAVSLFEQLISEDKISYSHIVETLGVASEDEKREFILKLMQEDVTLLDDFNLLSSTGKNIKNFFKEILGDIQSGAIQSLKNGQNISKSVALMEELQSMLMKSKNSFDESITFRIGLLKLLSGSGEQVSSVQTQAASIKQSTPSITAETSKQTPISHPVADDIVAGAENIFASSEISTQPQVTSSGSGFDINSLIAACKKQGGKAALSMTIKGADFDMQGDVLQIATKTKIALGTLKKTENREILMLALEDMGTPVSDIKLT
ncbi:DNA polymerase III subunit gamma/tau [Candidatus Gracilibacteria bacterium]|nr:DNA polymerase III subunit gamma/tau [Candidatus Gracilibacteria bacterium]